MAQSWRVHPGAAVRYRTAAGRTQHAVVTAVTDQATVALRIGNGATKLVKSGMAKVAGGVAGGEGWFRS